jgi:hypothetical protein
MFAAPLTLSPMAYLAFSPSPTCGACANARAFDGPLATAYHADPGVPLTTGFSAAVCAGQSGPHLHRKCPVCGLEVVMELAS